MLRPTAPAFSPPGAANGDGNGLRPGGLGNAEISAVNDMLDRLTIATKQESAAPAKAPPAKPAAAPAPSAPKPAITGGIKILGKAQAPAAPAPAAAAKPSWPPVAGAPAAKAPSGGRDGVARELADYVKSRGVRVMAVSGAGVEAWTMCVSYITARCRFGGLSNTKSWGHARHGGEGGGMCAFVGYCVVCHLPS